MSTSNFGGNIASVGNKVLGGAGGNGGAGGTTPAFGSGRGGNATVGGDAMGGAIAVSSNIGNITLNNSTFSQNAIAAGAGGKGGPGGFAADGISDTGGNASGGAVSYSIADNSGNSSAYTIAIQSTPFSNNQVSAGAGGGATATFTSVATAVSGSGQGGGLYVYDQIGAITITADSSNFTSNTVTGGKGRRSSLQQRPGRGLRPRRRHRADRLSDGARILHPDQ